MNMLYLVVFALGFSDYERGIAHCVLPDVITSLPVSKISE